MKLIQKALILTLFITMVSSISALASTFVEENDFVDIDVDAIIEESPDEKESNKYGIIPPDSVQAEINAGSRTLNKTRAASGSWVAVGAKWKFKYTNNTYAVNKWEQVGDKWYHFDGSGYVQMGWFKDSDAKWYYLQPGDGYMRVSWILDGSTWYYCNASGVMQTGWQSINSKQYYFNTSGAMQRTVFSYKLNKFTEGSDALAINNSLKSKYTTKLYNASSVTNSGFYSNSEYIKYWSSHALTSGQLYGDNTTAKVQIFNDKSSFSWAGDNLEFVILAACNQLNGSSPNPRTKYAQAMIGNSGVRVIAGYHDKAPGNDKAWVGADVRIANEFTNYVKNGESVKSAWMKANDSNKLYCVLTHAGDLQYSRIEGFGGDIFDRPQSNNKTILRFSYVNQNGITELARSLPNEYSGLSFIENINTLESLTVPTYSLKKNDLIHPVKEEADVMVFKDDGKVIATSGEIGDTSIIYTEDEAIKLSKEWMDEIFEDTDSEILTDKQVNVHPIVMAEVNLDGGKEEEQVIAYTVEYENNYEGIRITDDIYRVTMDNAGVEYSTLHWNEYEIVQEGRFTRSQQTLSFSEATQVLSSNINISRTSAPSNIVNNVELTFEYDINSDTYKPAWTFIMKDDIIYTINAHNGVVIKK